MERNIKNIHKEGELDAEATIRNFLIVQTEGQRQVSREVQHVGFKMVLAIGYRVRSRTGMHFRNWASRILTKYTQKEFAMNDERLKNPKPFGADYSCMLPNANMNCMTGTENSRVAILTPW